MAICNILLRKIFHAKAKKDGSNRFKRRFKVKAGKNKIKKILMQIICYYKLSKIKRRRNRRPFTLLIYIGLSYDLANSLDAPKTPAPSTPAESRIAPTPIWLFNVAHNMFTYAALFAELKAKH